MNATIRCDSHSHLYHSYNLELWYRSAVENLRSGEQSAVPVIIVADRHTQDSKSYLQAQSSTALSWTPFAGLHGGILEGASGPLIVIIGAQYVAAERIEVLAFEGSRQEWEGLPAAEILKNILAVNSLPCLPWSPGKWSGKRGGVVRGLMEQFSPFDVVIGDIPIRPACLPVPELLKEAGTKGFSILRGSDPLPFAAEEKLAGSFGCRWQANVDSGDLEEVAIAVMDTLRARTPADLIGRPNGLLQGAMRFLRSNLCKKRQVRS